MNKVRKYSPETRGAGGRLVPEHAEEYSSQCAAIESISQKVGCTPQTLRAPVDVERAEVEAIRASQRPTVAFGVATP